MVYVRNDLALKYSNISCRDSSVVEHLPSMRGAGFDSPSIIKPNNLESVSFPAKPELLQPQNRLRI